MSNVFTPLLTPTYGVLAAMYASILNPIVDGKTKLIVAAITLFITGVVPMLAIGALYLTKRVSDPGLNNQSERTVPYIISGVCYIACAIYLYSISAPTWLWTFPIGGLMAVVVSIIVNRWWKISAHLAGMGGVTAIFFTIALKGVAMPGIVWWAAGSIFITGLLATSRVELGRHTVGQTLAGAANGFLWVFLASMLPL